MSTLRPIILKHGEYGQTELQELRQKPLWREIDIYASQLDNLFEILHPNLRGPVDQELKAEFQKQYSGDNTAASGDWVYFPWSGELVHTIKQADVLLLRTNRNRNLINSSEQEQLGSKKIAIAGLSVGGGIARALAYGGIGLAYRLADFDILETPNLNRVQARLADVGSSKAELIARQIWEVHPSVEINLVMQAVKDEDIVGFLTSDGGVDVVFDEVDDFKLKIQLRLAAKKLGVPLIMMTALGDSVLIDLERYDLDADLAIFNGLIGDLDGAILNGEITKDDERRYAAQLVGIGNVPTRAIESLNEMGASLVGRPQLGSTVQVEAGLGAYIARKVLLEGDITSGRYRIDFNQVVDLESDVRDSEARSAALAQLFGK